MWAMINDDFEVNIKLTNVMCHRHEYYNGPGNESEHLDKIQRIGLGHERLTITSCEVTLHYNYYMLRRCYITQKIFFPTKQDNKKHMSMVLTSINNTSCQLITITMILYYHMFTM